MILDREKMKDKVKKLKLRRGKILDLDKTCKNCHKDFIESENFNWSCRTHRSAFSGEIWWCCGKDSIDQPGCKYSAHVSKDDSDGEEEDFVTQNKPANVRCQCCKETGHLIQDCPRDPNIRSKIEPDEELLRIQKIKDYRKLNADTVITTTHFLKKCVIVPNRATEQDERHNQMNPFARGSMKFDDFNYDQFNPYILVQENKGKDK